MELPKFGKLSSVAVFLLAAALLVDSFGMGFRKTGEPLANLTLYTAQ